MLKNVKEWQESNNRYSACRSHIKGISSMYIKGAITAYDEVYLYSRESGKVYGYYQGPLANNIFYASIYSYDKPENILDLSALDKWYEMSSIIETSFQRGG